MGAGGNRVSGAEWRLWHEVILSYGIISTQTKRVTGMEREEAGVKRWDTDGYEQGDQARWRKGVCSHGPAGQTGAG